MKISFLKGKPGELVQLNALISEHSVALNNHSDVDALLQEIGDARYVLLGKASHGTHEYYTWRSHISKRLIEEKGFSFIAVEGDWPDCYRLNRFVKNYPDSGKIAERYDAFVYLDKTSALHPLHIKPDGTQIPGSFPFGV